uniref:Uncharacterized protein n=1 Tax=Arundo donax TaxID=35708 RepID=A0A0A9B2U1_ARUDO
MHLSTDQDMFLLGPNRKKIAWHAESSKRKK